MSLALLGVGASTAEAQQGKTFRWGAAREIASLDPYSFGETFTLSVLNHVYEGLVRYTGQLKIEPALAAAGLSERCRMLLQVHDELIFEVEDEAAETPASSPALARLSTLEQEVLRRALEIAREGL